MQTAALVPFLAGFNSDTGAIPYDTDAGVSIWLFVKVILITASLLALAYAALFYLKRKNLLSAWYTGKIGDLKVIDSCRLSPRTTVYVIKHGTRRALIAESSLHIAVVPLGDGKEGE